MSGIPYMDFLYNFEISGTVLPCLVFLDKIFERDKKGKWILILHSFLTAYF